MVNSLKVTLIVFISMLLAACFQTELGGTVAGATVTIRDLRSGDVVEKGLNSLSLADFIAEKSRQAFDQQSDIGKMINLGNFEVERSLYDGATWYLVTASGGADMDIASDGAVEEPFTEVSGKWHALMTGRQLREGGFMVSSLTEALYQSVRGELDSLDDAQLGSRLNQQSRLILPDINDDGVINYTDALGWSVIVSRDAYLRDFDQVIALAQAVREGASQASIQTLALDIFAEPVPDAFEFYQANISGPIVQARCVNCHTSGGVAPNSGARLVIVTNSNSNFLAINHQAFQDFRDQLNASQDLSDYVTGKASDQINHGGGRQITPGSEQFRNLETYLNLIE
ncbi:MAG: hypothetical protein V7720_10355 [Halioglobus sp.]